MSKMERSRRLSGSSFGVSSGRSEPNASEKPENAIVSCFGSSCDAIGVTPLGLFQIGLA